MKSFHFYIVLSLVALLALSCNKGDITDMGVSIQPEGDKIAVKTDTFHLTSNSFFVDRIYNRADSLLLGTYIDEKYGTVHADVLARVEAPYDSTGFRLPMDMDDLKADSAFLILSYNAWFGAPNSVMSLKAYEMNQDSILDYYANYPSDINPDLFVDKNKPNALLSDAILEANSASSIQMKLTGEFTNRLFDITKNFTDENDFFKKFNGLYLESNIGDATMIYIRGVRILLYYSYKNNNLDTTFVNTVSYNVKQTVINRFQHPDKAIIKNKLDQQDSINYIASPANIYAQVNVPMKKMIESMQNSIGTDKRLIVNSAIINVEAKDTDNKTETSDIALPLPGYMLLMKKADLNDFFTRERSTSDSIVYAAYNSTDSCYSFNIAAYIDREVRRLPRENGKILVPNNLENMEMVLIPVRVNAASDAYGNTTISSLKQQVLMTGVAIRSGNHPDRPMKVNLLYSAY